MVTSLRYTTRDLEALPDPHDGTRFEIIDGELYVSRQPSLHHQDTVGLAFAALHMWDLDARLGRAYFAPGVIFADDDNVAPDLVWISRRRFEKAAGDDGKLHTAPELIAEVLSPGAANEIRDREKKLKLYSRRGVEEYWILDTVHRLVEVYRRFEPTLDLLRLAATVRDCDDLESPLLPGFRVKAGDLFSEPSH